MSDPRPYLAFPAAATVRQPSGTGFPGPKVVGPPPAEQAARIGPKLDRLHSALEARRVNVHEAADEGDPRSLSSLTSPEQ